MYEEQDPKEFIREYEETLKKNNIEPCSKKEFERYERLLKQDDEELHDTIQKYFHIGAVNLAFSHPAYSMRYFVYPIIMSGKSEEEIVRLLKLLIPPNFSYL